MSSNRSTHQSSIATHQQGEHKARRATIHRRYPPPSRAKPTIQCQPTSTKLSYPSTTSAKSLCPPSPPHNQYIPPPPQFGTTNPKSSLANHLQLTPWHPHYRATPPPMYHGNADPHKFLMFYEATIASAGGDEATLAKSLIIFLEDAAANWYSKLPSGCIYSWPQLKEKFLLNFQGFQVELDSEEDFMSCIQGERNAP
jgi:hypothetical protein